jgi:hypothetical protein
MCAVFITLSKFFIMSRNHFFNILFFSLHLTISDISTAYSINFFYHVIDYITSRTPRLDVSRGKLNYLVSRRWEGGRGSPGGPRPSP